MAKTAMHVTVQREVHSAISGVMSAMGVSRSRAAELILAAWLVEHGWLEYPEDVMRRTMASGQQVSGFWVPRSPPDGGKTTSQEDSK